MQAAVFNAGVAIQIFEGDGADVALNLTLAEANGWVTRSLDDTPFAGGRDPGGLPNLEAFDAACGA